MLKKPKKIIAYESYIHVFLKKKNPCATYLRPKDQKR